MNYIGPKTSSRGGIGIETAGHINLNTGNIDLPVTLAEISGENGLTASIGLHYNSKAALGAELRNEDASSGVAGLGWSLEQAFICRDTGRNGSLHDDSFYLFMGTMIPLYPKGREYNTYYFESEKNPLWTIEYDPDFNHWKIVMEDGGVYCFGENAATSQSIEWGVKWGNWVGSSRETAGQTQFALVWNLTSSRSATGQFITYSYEQVQVRAGGEGGLPFTREAYVSQIRLCSGETIRLHYREKQPEEYRTPLPQSFQDRVQTRYLDRLEVHDSSGTRLYSVLLSYSFLNAAELTKRLLVSITKQSALEDRREIHPPLTFAYFTESDGVGVSLSDNKGRFRDGALYGALKSVTTPEGQVTAYTYGKQKLSGTSLSLRDVRRPQNDNEQWKHPRAYFGPDYTVIAWEGDNQLYATVYQWHGTWMAQELGVFPGAGADCSFFLEQDFFALVTPGQPKSLTIFRKSRKQYGKWDSYPQSVQLNKGCEVAAGPRHIAILNGGVLHRFHQTRTGWTADGSVTLDTANKTVFGFAGKSNYVFVAYARPDNSQKPALYVTYLDITGAWQETKQEADHFFPKEERELTRSESGILKLVVQPSDSFAAVQAHAMHTVSYGAYGTNKYYKYKHFVYRWDEQFSNWAANSLSAIEIHVGTGMSVPTDVYMTVAGDVVSVLQPSANAKFVYRFDGVNWNPFRLQMDRIDHFHGMDSALEVSASWGMRTSRLMQYNPAKNEWKSQLDFSGPDIEFVNMAIGIAASLITFAVTLPMEFVTGAIAGLVMDFAFSFLHLPEGFREGAWRGMRYCIVDKQVYVQLHDRSWSALGKLFSDNKRNLLYSTLTLTDAHSVYMTYEDALDVSKDRPETYIKNLRNYVPVFRNGLLVEQLTLETAEEVEKGWAKWTTEPSPHQPSLIGRDVVLAYPRLHAESQLSSHKDDFKRAARFSLFRIAEDAVSGELSDYVVQQITQWDGYQKYEMFIEYDGGLPDPSMNVVLYNKVTVTAGMSKEDAGKRGKTVYYYYNGSSEAAPNRPVNEHFDNVTEYPALAAGLPYRQEVWEAGAEKPLQSETTYYKAWKIEAVPGSRSMKPMMIVSERQGVRHIQQFVYDIADDPSALRTGILKSTITVNGNMDGQLDILQTDLIYAHEAYASVRNMGIWNQVAAETTRQAARPVNVIADLTKLPLLAASGGTTLSSAATVWQSWPDGLWLPVSSYRWTGTEHPVFQWWEGGVIPSDWRKQNSILQQYHGIVTETEGPDGTVVSHLYDKSRTAEIATFVNASISRGEAAYVGFERYEDLQGWRVNGQAIDESQLVHGGHTGSFSLRLGSASTLGQAVPLERIPVTQQRFVMAVHVKMDPVVMGSCYFGVIAHPLNGREFQSVSKFVTGTDGVWKRYELLIDIERLRRENKWGDECGVALSLFVRNETMGTILVDDVAFFPLGGTFRADVLHESHKHVTAVLDENGLAAKYFYNQLQQRIAVAGPDGRIVSNMLAAYSRTSVSPLFKPASPNFAMQVESSGPSAYWNGPNDCHGPWHTIDNTQFVARPETYADSFGVRVQIGNMKKERPTEIFLDMGCMGIHFIAHHKLFRFLIHGMEHSYVPVSRMPSDWLLLILDTKVYVYADGALLLQTSLQKRVFEAIRFAVVGDTSSLLTNVMVFQDLRLSAAFMDAGNKIRQKQAYESSSSVIVTETLYDAQGAAVMHTLPVRKQADADFPQMFGFESKLVDGRDPAGGHPLWDTNPANAQRRMMTGQIRAWYGTDSPYPYTGIWNEPNPLARPLQSALSGKEYALGSNHAVQYEYGLWGGPKDALSAVLRASTGVQPTDELLGQFQAQTAKLPLNDTAKVQDIRFTTGRGGSSLKLYKVRPGRGQHPTSIGRCPTEGRRKRPVSPITSNPGTTVRLTKTRIGIIESGS
ncbi:hypothetical protein SD70_07475 [Gordoniibacillus kamchatkensis]|uniref:PI-PLC Y-box domain-containing protein n=1 Tax=Gordoniibacillus kamchatkensis TaxID=1590651 RepID=A0ABR5AKZ6_9BACL|nr:hypothetical protein SD70_07475 [Paenibacillus sp. VKM B-2647]